MVHGVVAHDGSGVGLADEAVLHCSPTGEYVQRERVWRPAIDPAPVSVPLAKQIVFDEAAMFGVKLTLASGRMASK